MTKRGVISSSVISVILGGFGIVGAVSALEYQTNPSSGDNPVTLKFEFGQTLTISTGGNISIASLTPGTKAISNSNYNVTVSTNNLTGYTLSATVGCSSGTDCYDSKNLSDGTNNFTMLTSDGTLTSGTWGVSLDSSATENSSFKTLAKYDETATILNQTTSNTGTAATGYTGTTNTTVRIGAYAANSQVAGTYTNSINFIAVANALPIFIQDLTLSECQVNVGTNGNDEGIGDTITVYDKRDGNDYTVRYINGECWMTQNLRFASSSIPATTSNTVVDRTLNYYDLEINGSNEGECSSANGRNYACIKESGSLSTGVWYNYYAATAGTISGASSSMIATEDICPKNWHLPSGPNTTSDTDIKKIVGNTTSGWQAATTGMTAFGAVFDGYYENGSLGGSVGYGGWWSATAYNATYNYYLEYASNYNQIKGDALYLKSNGFFIRCVKSP